MNLKKYTSFSGRMITIIQLSALVMSIVGAFFVPWTWVYILTTLFFFYLYSSVGMSMMLHRYWAHRSFEFKNPLLRKVFIFIAMISARGSPLAWAHIHRTHHKYADKENDPHRPEKFSWFSFQTTYITELKIFLIRDFMTDEHKVLHEYYLMFILGWCLFLLIVNPFLLYFVWILPVCLNQLAQDSWNYFSHVNGGYRNFDTTDKSQNVSWLFPLVLGEAWHNNHHKDPQSYTTKVKKWEYDPVSYLIRIVGT